MRKIYLMIASIAMLSTACQEKSFDNNQPMGYATLTAVTESYDCGTKTFLTSDGKVLWKAGDQISFFNLAAVNEKYQVDDTADGKTVTKFKYISGFKSGTSIAKKVALYPYSESAAITESGTSYSLAISLPATQEYTQNSFANGAFPMVAVSSTSTDNNLYFKNIMGGLKLQLKGSLPIRKITICGNNDEILYGSATVTASSTGTPSISFLNTTAKEVTLDCGAEGISLDPDTPTNFIIALPPMTMQKGFKVSIYDTDGCVHTITSNQSQTINRSNLLRMPAVVFNPTPVHVHDYVIGSMVFNHDILLGIKDTLVEKVPASLYDPESDGFNTYACVTTGTKNEFSLISQFKEFGKDIFLARDSRVTFEIMHSSNDGKWKVSYSDDDFKIKRYFGEKKDSIQLSSTQFADIVKNPAKAPDIVFNGTSITNDTKVLIKVTEECQTIKHKEKTTKVGYYYVVFRTPYSSTHFSGNSDSGTCEGDIVLCNLMSGSDKAYIPDSAIRIYDHDGTTVLFQYNNGKMVATDYAKDNYGFEDKECSVWFREGREVTYPNVNGYDSKESFGGGLVWDASDGLSVEWHPWLDLLWNKYAEYNITVTVSRSEYYTFSGNITVLSTVNSYKLYPEKFPKL